MDVLGHIRLSYARTRYTQDAIEKIVAPLLLVATSAAHITGGNLCNGEQGDFRERLAATVQQLQDLLPSGRSLQDVVDASKDKSVAKAGSRGRCKTAFFQVSGGQSGLDYSKGLLRPWTTERTRSEMTKLPCYSQGFSEVRKGTGRALRPQPCEWSLLCIHSDENQLIMQPKPTTSPLWWWILNTNGESCRRELTFQVGES